MVTKRSLIDPEKTERAGSALDQAMDAGVFLGFLIVSAVAVAAVAVAAPLVLAFSAIAGLISKNKSDSSWRSAGA